MPRRSRPSSAPTSSRSSRRPTHLELAAAKKVYEKRKIDISTPAARIRHVVQSAFNGRRIVVFSGGEAKDLDGVFNEVRAVRDGGGNGSIIGRNTFQRPKAEALEMLAPYHRDLPGAGLIARPRDDPATTRLYLITPPAFDPERFADRSRRGARRRRRRLRCSCG